MPADPRVPTDEQIDELVEETFEHFNDEELDAVQLLGVIRCLAKAANALEAGLNEMIRAEPLAFQEFDTDRYAEVRVSSAIVRHWIARLDVPA